jgi:hypothetical protein
VKDPCEERAFAFPKMKFFPLPTQRKQEKELQLKDLDRNFSLSLHQQCPFNFDESFLLDFLIQLKISTSNHRRYLKLLKNLEGLRHIAEKKKQLKKIERVK